MVRRRAPGMLPLNSQPASRRLRSSGSSPKMLGSDPLSSRLSLASRAAQRARRGLRRSDAPEVGETCANEAKSALQTCTLDQQRTGRDVALIYGAT